MAEEVIVDYAEQANNPAEAAAQLVLKIVEEEVLTL